MVEKSLVLNVGYSNPDYNCSRMSSKDLLGTKVQLYLHVSNVKIGHGHAINLKLAQFFCWPMLMF